MITDHRFRPDHGNHDPSECAWLGRCGRPASEHRASVKLTPTKGRVGKSKLTHSEVQGIKRALAEGGSPTVIAGEFEISRQTVSAIKSGRIWRNA